MTETTFFFCCPLAGLGFSLTLRHIPLLLGSVLFWSWVNPFLPDFVGSGAKGSEGSWTRITSLHFYLLTGCYFIISLAIPETGRVVAMSNPVHCGFFIASQLIGTLGAFYLISLHLSFLHVHQGSNGINWGQGRGSGNGFRIGLAPRTEGTGSFAQ
jgi:hypothetical protein